MGRSRGGSQCVSLKRGGTEKKLTAWRHGFPFEAAGGITGKRMEGGGIWPGDTHYTEARALAPTGELHWAIVARARQLRAVMVACGIGWCWAGEVKEGR
jgi:hypothetical protein